ncbi:hypothetical protein GQ53DRAFT_187638 [Thozetella sp. PMI_491]|nr:hypothetical protein GQ53DRAFT_187638 [Thozetella sp. PMI_491]
MPSLSREAQVICWKCTCGHATGLDPAILTEDGFSIIEGDHEITCQKCGRAIDQNDVLCNHLLEPVKKFGGLNLMSSRLQIYGWQCCQCGPKSNMRLGTGEGQRSCKLAKKHPEVPYHCPGCYVINQHYEVLTTMETPDVADEDSRVPRGALREHWDHWKRIEKENPSALPKDGDPVYVLHECEEFIRLRWEYLRRNKFGNSWGLKVADFEKVHANYEARRPLEPHRNEPEEGRSKPASLSTSVGTAAIDTTVVRPGKHLVKPKSTVRKEIVPKTRHPTRKMSTTQHSKQAPGSASMPVESVIPSKSIPFEQTTLPYSSSSQADVAPPTSFFLEENMYQYLTFPQDDITSPRNLPDDSTSEIVSSHTETQSRNPWYYLPQDSHSNNTTATEERSQALLQQPPTPQPYDFDFPTLGELLSPVRTDAGRVVGDDGHKSQAYSQGTSSPKYPYLAHFTTPDIKQDVWSTPTGAFHTVDSPGAAQNSVAINHAGMISFMPDHSPVDEKFHLSPDHSVSGFTDAYQQPADNLPRVVKVESPNQLRSEEMDKGKATPVGLSTLSHAPKKHKNRGEREVAHQIGGQSMYHRLDKSNISRQPHSKGKPYGPSTSSRQEKGKGPSKDKSTSKAKNQGYLQSNMSVASPSSASSNPNAVSSGAPPALHAGFADMEGFQQDGYFDLEGNFHFYDEYPPPEDEFRAWEYQEEE